MKKKFIDADELHRLAVVAGFRITHSQARRMWKGDFRKMGIEAVEAFFAMVGYRVMLQEDKRLG